MQPLLKIQTVPIQVSFSTKRAQLRQNTTQPRAQVTRVKGRADIQTDPARLKMDSTEARASIGQKTVTRLNRDFAETGKVAGHEAVTKFSQRGTFYKENAHGPSRPVAEWANRMTRVMSNRETIMTFLPSARPEMWVEGGSISFDYTPDQLQYDWQLQTRPEMEYEPGGVEFTIAQYPEVIIEYLGSPVYVPRSADPNYDPPPVVDQSI